MSISAFKEKEILGFQLCVNLLCLLYAGDLDFCELRSRFIKIGLLDFCELRSCFIKGANGHCLVFSLTGLLELISDFCNIELIMLKICVFDK